MRNRNNKMSRRIMRRGGNWMMRKIRKSSKMRRNRRNWKIRRSNRSRRSCR